MDIKDRSAVVTGGASGLGAATARRLSAKGAKVAIFDVQPELGSALAREIGGIFCEADVRSEAGIDAAFGRARDAHGQETILVCCAGTGKATKTVSRSRDDGSVRHYPLDAFEAIIQINLIGTFRCVAKSAAGMLQLDPGAGGERGAVVLTSSVAAYDGQTGQAAYAASKAAIVGMTLPIARDLSGEGIRINTILPGIFDTPLMQGAPQNVKDGLSASIPFPKRFGSPDEFAELALAMIEIDYLNGEHVRLDGGVRMSAR